ncbi:MAG: GTP 3',8-cyclase MoaA [Flavobacteriales bacterium]
MLIDNHHRIHDYLRISLTNNCNLRCFYCMPNEDLPYTPPASLMQTEEIDTIVATFVKLGIKKIRLTGGEPLVRKDAEAILDILAQYPVELTMTTNGVRLHDFFDQLKRIGLRSLNISLDTLKAARFKEITKRDEFKKVYANILRAVELGFSVKVNVVAMKGVNDDEILDFVALTKNLPLHIRFIEFMPFSGNQWQDDKVIGWKEILKIVGDAYDMVPLIRLEHDTAKKYKVIGHEGTFAVISTMTSPFCGDCNRMRLTADGKMKNCLFSKGENDILSALRRGENIEPLIIQNIKTKAAERGGQITPQFKTADAVLMHNRSMINIGG